MDCDLYGVIAYNVYTMTVCSVHTTKSVFRWSRWYDGECRRWRRRTQQQKSSTITKSVWSSSPFAAVLAASMVVAFVVPPTEAASMRLCGEKLTRTLQGICRNKLCGSFADETVSKSSLLLKFVLAQPLDYVLYG